MNEISCVFVCFHMNFYVFFFVYLFILHELLCLIECFQICLNFYVFWMFLFCMNFYVFLYVFILYKFLCVLCVFIWNFVRIHYRLVVFMIHKNLKVHFVFNYCLLNDSLKNVSTFLFIFFHKILFSSKRFMILCSFFLNLNYLHKMIIF